MNLCRFERIAADRIRCTICGTERVTADDPATYQRPCGRGAIAPAYSLPEFHPLTDPCTHFGTVIRQGTCDVCGHRGKPYDIHACAIHGECQLRRFQTRNGPKWCGNCKEYQPLAAAMASN